MGKSNGTWKDQTARIWKDVTKAFPSIGKLSSAEALLDHTAFLVGNFVVAGTVSRFTVRVNYQPVAAETRLDTHPIKDKSGRSIGVLQQAEVAVLDRFEAYLPRTNPYRAVADSFPQLSETARAEKEMAVQLLHELIHAQLLIEADKGWPANERTLLSEFNAWAAPAWSNSLKAERDAVLNSIPAHKLTVLLNEKFAIQKSFGAFGVRVSNDQIVAKYVRTLPTLVQNNVKLALTRLFDRLDAARAQPTTPKGVPNAQPSAGVKTRQPRYYPRFLPIRGASASLPARPRVGVVSWISRPWPVSPVSTWPVKGIATGFGSTIGRQGVRTATPPTSWPWAAPAASPITRPPFGRPDRETSNPSLRAIVGGRIQPLRAQPLPTGPGRDSLRPGGRAWDPKSYAFSNLQPQEPYRYRPPWRVMSPESLGSKKMVWGPVRIWDSATE